MPKINKIYPSFFNGVSQQTPELILDNQCKEMINCIPSIVEGLQKRPPVNHVVTETFASYPEKEDAIVFHTYDRGEGIEEYIFIETGDSSEPLEIYNKAGEKQTVTYEATAITTLKNYLANGSLKGLTVQDRTWLFSKDVTVSLDYSATAPLDSNYTNVAYYWLKRGSGDRYNPYNYAVYIDGYMASVNPNKPSSEDLDPETGAEDSDFSANVLYNIINQTAPMTAGMSHTIAASGTYDVSIYFGKGMTSVTATGTGTSITGTLSYSSTTGYVTGTLTNGDTTDPQVATISISGTFPSGYNCEKEGSILKIWKDSYASFTFSSWDSWGNQASEGWQGSVNKISDLPKDMPFTDVYVKVLGDESNTFTDYFVKWNGSSWEECLDPEADRGQLTNMPIKCDRTSLVAGVATFTIDLVDWSLPRVGNIDNNPDPSFVGNTITDMFFYKNRLGIASEDSVTLTETANYTNFYTTTAVDIVDTDVVDVTIATNQASKIYYVKPFNNSLYVFTKYGQYELAHEGAFSPSTVSFSNTTNYPMNTDVEPVVINDSLFFISSTDNNQQLREYIKTETLNVKGIDLNVATPTYMEDPITKIVADGILGYILCCTANNKIYLYNYKEDGTKRIQSAWSTWTLLNDLEYTTDSFEYFSIGSTLLVICKTDVDYRYHTLQLDSTGVDDKIDSSTSSTYSYESSVTLPDYYPKITEVRTPLNKILIKKITIEGTGQFDADVYRKDYDVTYSKTHDLGMADLDLHVASKVGNVEITIKDSSENDFVISSVILGGLYTQTSREMR